MTVNRDLRCSLVFLKEPEIAVLLLLVLLVYATRLTTLDVRGEESRRGTVAQEMIRTGDLIVPRFHGESHFMSARPPLQMWAIAATSLVTGEVDLFAVRIPSVVAIAFLAMVIYSYSRTFLTRMGAFCTAAAYLSMLQVLELGRTGETDAVFTLFVTCSLLAWHAGKTQEWNPAIVWSLGYGFAALATLTKGPQGPVYFMAPVLVYLVASREWRYALRPAHLIGIFTFLCLWGPWQIAFFLSEGLDGVRHIYFGDVAMYGKEGSLIRHMIEYPLHLVISFFPWSLFLLPLFRREFRENLGTTRTQILFLVCCLAITFPTVWLVKGARTRFFMPLFPCVAILAGIVIQRCYEASKTSPLKKDWRRSHLLFAIAMPLVGLMTVVLAVSGIDWPLAQQPMGFAVGFLVMTLIGSLILWRARFDERPQLQQAAVFSIALFFGLIVNGVRMNALISTDVPRKEQVAAIEAIVPKNETIYTLGGDVVHPFSFLFHGEMQRLSYEQLSDLPDEVSYFCFWSNDDELASTLPIRWKPIGVVTCDRTRNKLWDSYLIVGQVTPEGWHAPTTQVVQSILPQFEFDEASPTRIARTATNTKATQFK